MLSIKRGAKGTLQKGIVLQERSEAPIEKEEVLGQELIVQGWRDIGTSRHVAVEENIRKGQYLYQAYGVLL